MNTDTLIKWGAISAVVLLGVYVIGFYRPAQFSDEEIQAQRARRLAAAEGLKSERAKLLANYQAAREKVASDASRAMAAKEYAKVVDIIRPWETVADPQLAATYDAAKAQVERARQAQAKIDADRAAKACRADVQCFAKGIAAQVEGRCERAVEDLAKHDFKWIDGWTEPKFSGLAWVDQKAGIVGLVGDKIKMQNGFGAWTRVKYACRVDVQKVAVLGAIAIER